MAVQEAGNANQAIADDAVLAFAKAQERTVLTLNRRDFICLHKRDSDHSGIIVVTDDTDKVRLAERINRVIQAQVPLKGKLVRVTKSD